MNCMNRIITLTFFALLPLTAFAANVPSPAPLQMPPLSQTALPLLPTVAPSAPALQAKAYVLMDGESGKILASQNPDVKLPPASLTKIMTSYIVSHALKAGRLHLDDPVHVSEKAWRMGGSKMFIKIGSTVSVRDLMQGIIVQSGNDASVAIAEHLAGSEDAFVALMNQQAATLGMANTHFTDSTGMPDPNHYTTAHDMALLARALIYNFPEDYAWYSQKWFVYNGIKQPNRNRLLWHDQSIDGIKTGHTDEAGFCLVASGKRANTRLISVLLGAPSDKMRAEESTKLLNYGFRFFETRKLFLANQVLGKTRAWKGKNRELLAGLTKDLYVTLLPSQYPNLQAHLIFNTPIIAPVYKGQTVGSVNVSLNNETIASTPLVALADNPKGGFWVTVSDATALTIHRLVGKAQKGG